MCPEASPLPLGLARPRLHVVTGGPPPPQGLPEPPERSRPNKNDAPTCGVLAFKLTALSHPLAIALVCVLAGFTGSSQWAGGPGGTCNLGPLRSWGRPRAAVQSQRPSSKAWAAHWVGRDVSLGTRPGHGENDGREKPLGGVDRRWVAPRPQPHRLFQRPWKAWGKVETPGPCLDSGTPVPHCPNTGSLVCLLSGEFPLPLPTPGWKQGTPSVCGV